MEVEVEAAAAVEVAVPPPPPPAAGDLLSAVDVVVDVVGVGDAVATRHSSCLSLAACFPSTQNHKTIHTQHKRTPVPLSLLSLLYFFDFFGFKN